jgi:hypothetical protein
MSAAGKGALDLVAHSRTGPRGSCVLATNAAAALALYVVSSG